MPKRVLEEFVVGETAVFSRTFTEIDVAQFIGITWDVNPFHTDSKFCETHRVGRRIVPGLLVGSM
ncbi:MAG: enoyl-CoA hydratase, partial [Chloroflexota bacterium]|nr:enoyl-CoA hydratase [Chloroflexota bacterium]